jgi:hypothetical protein
MEINQSIPSAEVLNIFDSSEPRSINTSKYFFRTITGSRCEISHSEQKKHISKLVHYFKYGNLHEYKESDIIEHSQMNLIGINNLNE